ncbi:hypothetical protein BGZ80_002890 [Entomortierella chlamydospora]|uniref:BZIP domain-containing protein n=1 Tax=Entomortierella chlamydospora TaxID=101097 RepID=A0A9P6SWY9_9FUNG|nr:hypothetical protein BGZ79_002757 [Entomortierella chlamydospora]KAG0008938.1 hypothetical protein BGZ80_002890 [Entomortierella chlamydospora]
MTTTNFTTFSAGTAERLMKSADSLDFALQGANKKGLTTGLSRQGLLDFGSLDSIFGGVSDISATLFDDWLANDLQQAGFLSHDESLCSSPSDSDSNSPRISNQSDSPVVGFDSIASDAELIQSSDLDCSTALFPEVQQASTPSPVFAFNTVAAAPAAATAAPMLPLTPEAVQQAAAALNIPWSKSLETAVLAQSLLASIPMALQMPMRPVVPTLTPVASAAQTAASPSPVLSPKQSERDMSPVSPVASERAPSATPSVPSTPRMSLSILSSTQTPVPGTSSVKATTYKSAYRSASLPRSSLKRDRAYDEPPSVLDGRDLSEMDEVALKRAKNTDAARRSRHKKLVKMEGLEQRVAELEIENSMFETKLNEVELERSLLADKDQMQQARIQELEKMLASLREKLY